MNYLRYSYKFLEFRGFSDDLQKLEMHSSYKLQCDILATSLDERAISQYVPVQQLMLEGLYHLDELENNGNSRRQLINTPHKSNKYQLLKNKEMK